jgi:integrase
MKIDNGHVARAVLPAGKVDICFWDDALTGFGLRLRLQGDKVRKSFIVQYRNATGRTRRLLIGGAEKLTPTQAREAAKKALAKVALGEDPQQERVEKRVPAMAMRKVVDRYFEALEVRKRKLRDNSMIAIKRYLTGLYYKPLHSIDINAIRRIDVSACISANIRAHGNTAAARARTVLSAFFAWCVGEGLVEQNPVIGTNVPDEAEARSRVLSDEELAKIWLACWDDDYGRVIRLLILLGARKSEVGGMHWDELEFEQVQPAWTLPAERSKNRKPLTLPLLGQVLDIIRSIPRKPGRNHLFGLHADKGFTSWFLKDELDERSGVTGWTVHDLRRSFSTGLGDLGVQPHVIEEVLNHKRRGVAGTYNRSPYWNEVRSALSLWDDHVHAMVTGAPRKFLPFEQRTA